MVECTRSNPRLQISLWGEEDCGGGGKDEEEDDKEEEVDEERWSLGVGATI